MIDLTTATPLSDAVDSLGRKSPLGIALSSEAWDQLPAEIRERAFFSAHVESERILAEAQRRIQQRVKLERDALEAGGRVMERARFIEEMQAILEDLGYRPEPEKEGSLQDLSSAGRLGLIWQMQLDQAHGYAGWKAGMDQAVLDAFPAQELVRDFDKIERRDWPRIWADANGVFYGDPGPDYPQAPGRMIALKTDPIWTEISRFGVPWPPFDWGSGMGLRDIRRGEAERLGLLDPEDPMIPQQQPFTAGLLASAKGLPPSALERLQERFGANLIIDAAQGLLRWISGEGGAQ